MKELSFETIAERIRKIKLPEADIVVGIGRGGVVPGILVAYKTGCDFKKIIINYRNDDNEPVHPEPVTSGGISIGDDVKRILIVDDVSVSGKTLAKAKELLSGYEVRTLVLKGKADHVVFPEIETCVKWPWKDY